MPDAVQLTLQQRIVEAAATLPAYGAVTGWAALAWCNARWFDGTDGHGGELPVPLVVGPGYGARSGAEGIVISQDSVMPHHIVRVDGIRVAVPVYSLGHMMCRARSVKEAVTMFDMAAYDDLVSREELVLHLDSWLAGRTGVGTVREALALTCENAWSPPEVAMRLAWKAHRPDAVLLANVPVFDMQGRHIATPDLLDVSTGVAGEYEGAVHLVGSARASDVRRDGHMRAVRLEPVTMVSADLQDPREFHLRLDQAYARCTTSSQSRSWTIMQPPWWTDTSTVAARRGLSEAQQRRLLAYRRPAA